MKKKFFLTCCLSYLLVLAVPLNLVQAQSVPCVFKAPVFKIDFGNEQMRMDLNQASLAEYREVFHSCPNDGYYSVVARTSDCYSGHWLTLNQDHTPNDIGGKMMLVNAAITPSTFFVTLVSGLEPGKTYELSAWMVNVCLACVNDEPIAPRFSFQLETLEGRLLASFSTGDLTPTGLSNWIQYGALFTTPATVGSIRLKISNKMRGGCGNDFAMDDIMIRECVVPKPVVKKEVKPVLPVKQSTLVKAPVAKEKTTQQRKVKNDLPVLTKIPVRDSPVIARPVIKKRAVIELPKPIVTRANPVIKQIETGKAEVTVDLYDNGEIDGDTVSIYHNNILIVSRAGLSAKPVTFKIPVDPLHPYHELVMVANNLGSIPPNTSLMIVTTPDKRYEVFISSSEQKNAKVLINLKE